MQKPICSRAPTVAPSGNRRLPHRHRKLNSVEPFARSLGLVPNWLLRQWSLSSRPIGPFGLSLSIWYYLARAQRFDGLAISDWGPIR